MSDSGSEKLEDRDADEEAVSVLIDRGNSIESAQKTSIANDEQDFAELPVVAYKAEIMECIRQNRIVICISETGRYCTCVAIYTSNQHLILVLYESIDRNVCYLCLLCVICVSKLFLMLSLLLYE